jgi:uncharacterized protein YidB (DUF937 family)
MSIFDSFKGILGQVGAAAAPALVSEVLAKTGFGDLQTVVAKLQEGGLGEQVQSWLGSGGNLPNCEPRSEMSGYRILRSASVSRSILR